VNCLCETLRGTGKIPIVLLLLAATCSAQEFDQYGGFKALPSPNASTGHFRVEKFGNKWLFVDPANNAYFLLGMYVLQPDTHVDDMHGRNDDRITAKYGSTQKWAAAQESRLLSWGFNASGPNPHPLFLPASGNHPAKLPFILEVWPGGYSMRNIYNWAPAPVKNLVHVFSPNYKDWRSPSGIADYYDPNFGTFLKSELARDPFVLGIEHSATKNYMVGIFSDDGDFTNGFGAGPDFDTQPSIGHNNFHLALLVLTGSPLDPADVGFGFLYADPEVKSKKALRDMLVAKYGTIASLNAAWGSNYTTFDSSGKAINGESIGTGDGTNLIFSKTLVNVPISNLSLQVLVNGVAVAGDNSCCDSAVNRRVWGPTLASSSFDRSSGELTITFKQGHAPKARAAVTANYVQDGWGYGTGLMDEDFRASHQTWLGNEATHLNSANIHVRADLDQFLYEIAAHYFSTCRDQIEAALPGVLYFGPDPLGSWSAPSNKPVLKAAAQYLDAMLVGGGYPLSRAELDYIYTYFGDKPIIASQYRTANRDSALYRYGSSAGKDYQSQEARGQDYFEAVTHLASEAYANGDRPYIGSLWWQYLDNWGEHNNWGLVTLSDNAYDGKEATMGTGAGIRSFPCSAPLANYQCGGEERDYGDVITPVRQAHAELMKILLGGVAGVTVPAGGKR
jgi:hypothetical protein